MNGVDETIKTPDGSSPTYRQNTHTTEWARVSITSISNPAYRPADLGFSLDDLGLAPFDLILPASLVVRRAATSFPPPPNFRFTRGLGVQAPAGAPELKQDESDRLRREEGRGGGRGAASSRGERPRGGRR